MARRTADLVWSDAVPDERVEHLPHRFWVAAHDRGGGLDGARYADLTGLVALGNDTLRDIWAELGTLPPIADGTRQRYLGVAHGWAGGFSMPGWCNGSAGFVHLWTAAHTAFRDDRWADLAERAGWDAYLTPGIAQLCCGLAGQAYALLELYRHTGERRWLTAAAELAVRAAADVTPVRDGSDGRYIPGSLHKGELGVAVLAADLARPETASMPFFGSMR
jgi:hypothetical protein